VEPGAGGRDAAFVGDRVLDGQPLTGCGNRRGRVGGDGQVGQLDDDRPLEGVAWLTIGVVAVLVHRVADEVQDVRPDRQLVRSPGGLGREAETVGRLVEGRYVRQADRADAAGADQRGLVGRERARLDRLIEGDVDVVECVVEGPRGRDRGHRGAGGEGRV